MDEFQGWVLLGGVLWAAQNAVASGYKYINDIRNNVIIGSIGIHRLSRKHRQLIMKNDYLPMFRGLCTSSIVYGIFMISTGIAFNSSITFSLVSFIAGVITIIRTIWTYHLISSELDAMKSAIEGSIVE
jgi:hypothetical protein